MAVNCPLNLDGPWPSTVTLPVVRERGLHEAGEERVRFPRTRAELGMELTRHEERVLGDLDDLDELLLRPHPGHPDPALLELAQVVVVHLVPVAVPLLDDALPVQP